MKPAKSSIVRRGCGQARLLLSPGIVSDSNGEEKMDLNDYFETTRGTGVLSTADGEGRVNSAIYARPHVLQDGQVAFIMADRLTRQNLQQNPRAAYLFIEQGDGYRGMRLQLTKIGEEQDSELISKLRRRTYSAEDEARMGTLSLVRFRLDEQRPLIGAGPRT